MAVDRTRLRCPAMAYEGETAADILEDSDYIYLGYAVRNAVEMDAYVDAYVGVAGDVARFQALGSIPGPQGPLAPLVIGLAEPERVPVLIEWSGLHNESGGHVYYLDGHVEFRRYPGAWPMTEEVMELLHAMDALGPHIPQGTSHGDRNLVGAALPFVVVLMGVGLFSLWRFGPYPAIAVPLAYVLVGIGIYVLVTILPVVTPDGVVTYHVISFENPTHGGHR